MTGGVGSILFSIFGSVTVLGTVPMMAGPCPIGNFTTTSDAPYWLAGCCSTVTKVWSSFQQ